jgi:biotin transport system substrate-specific component
MTAAALSPSAPRTLADVVVPRSLVTDVALVAGFAALTAAAAQLTFHLPWTPVPITGQTFAVLAAGTVLGARRGFLSQLLYVAVGALGAPIYASGAGGWANATGATGGYLLGFVLAAALVGALSERRQDRSLLTSLPAMLAGSAVVYALGVPWLAWKLGVSGTKAVELGMAPFLIGDAVKLVAAGALAPGAWQLVRRLRDGDGND